jgi:putative transposase
MSNDTTIPFADPSFADALSDLVRDGAQRIIKQAVQAELDAFLQANTDQDDDGRRAVVRNGYQPERDVLTSVGRWRSAIRWRSHIRSSRCR